MQWREVPLSDVLQLAIDAVPVDPAGVYPMAGVFSFGKGLFRRQDLLGAETTYKCLHRLHSGEFVMSQLKAWEGALAKVPEEFDGTFLSPQFPTFRVTRSQVDVRFLGWLFRLPAVWEALRRESRGMGARRDSVSPATLLKQVVRLPLVEEQRRIGAKLDALSRKVDELRVVQSGAAADCALLWSAAARARIEEPRAPTKRVGAVLKGICGGGTPSKSDPRFWEGSIPWVSPKDMKSRKIMKAQEFISEDATAETPAHLIEPGAVLVVVRGMILVHTVPIAVLGVSAAINQDMKALIPSREVLPEYLSTVLWAKNVELLKLVEKSTHDTRKLETEKLLAFEIPVPTSLGDQQAVVTELSDLYQRIQAVETLQKESAAQVELLFPALLRETFTLQGSSNSSLTS